MSGEGEGFETGAPTQPQAAPEPVEEALQAEGETQAASAAVVPEEGAASTPQTTEAPVDGAAEPDISTTEKEPEKVPTLSESLDQAVADRDVEAAKAAGRAQFENFFKNQNWTAAEIARFMATEGSIVQRVRRALKENAAAANPDATTPDADKAQPLPETVDTAALAAEAQAATPTAEVAPDATLPQLDGTTPQPAAPEAAGTPPVDTEPTTPTDTATPAAPEVVPTPVLAEQIAAMDDQSALLFLKEKLLAMDKNAKDKLKQLDDMGFDMVNRWGEELAHAVENNFDVGTFMDFVSTGEYYSKIATEFGYKDASALEKEGYEPVGPAGIEAHTKSNPFSELSLLLEGLVAGEICDIDVSEKLLKKNALEVLKSTEFKEMIRRLTLSKESTHAFSKKVAERVSGKEKAELTKEGLSFMLLIPSKAEFMKATPVEANKPAAEKAEEPKATEAAPSVAPNVAPPTPEATRIP